jgi:hypothetical protein
VKIRSNHKEWVRPIRQDAGTTSPMLPSFTQYVVFRRTNTTTCMATWRECTLFNYFVNLRGWNVVN